MSTGGPVVGAEAQGDEVANGRHLFACDLELLDDLVNTQILKFSITVATGRRCF